VEAFYSGDSHYAPSRSGPLQPQVVPAHTAVELFAGPEHPVEGDDVLVLAHVVNTDTGVIPSGSVTFSVNGVPVLGALPVGDQGFVGIEFTNVVAGSYRIHAAYHATPHFFDSQADLSGDVAHKPASTAAETPAPGPSAPASNPVPSTFAAGASAVTPVSRESLGALLRTTLQALRHGGLAQATKRPQPFDSTMPGTLTERITGAVPAHLRTRAAKQATLAEGQHTFGQPGSGTLKLKLTGAGRRAVRQRRALPVKVIATFAPQAGAPVTSTHSLRLPRHGPA